MRFIIVLVSFTFALASLSVKAADQPLPKDCTVTIDSSLKLPIVLEWQHVNGEEGKVSLKGGSIPSGRVKLKTTSAIPNAWTPVVRYQIGGKGDISNAHCGTHCWLDIPAKASLLVKQTEILLSMNTVLKSIGKEPNVQYILAGFPSDPKKGLAAVAGDRERIVITNFVQKYGKDFMRCTNADGVNIAVSNNVIPAQRTTEMWEALLEAEKKMETAKAHPTMTEKQALKECKLYLYGFPAYGSISREHIAGDKESFNIGKFSHRVPAGWERIEAKTNDWVPIMRYQISTEKMSDAFVGPAWVNFPSGGSLDLKCTEAVLPWYATIRKVPYMEDLALTQDTGASGKAKRVADVFIVCKPPFDPEKAMENWNGKLESLQDPILGIAAMQEKGVAEELLSKTSEHRVACGISITISPPPGNGRVMLRKDLQEELIKGLIELQNRLSPDTGTPVIGDAIRDAKKVVAGLKKPIAKN